MPVVNVDGVNISYSVWGQGDPLVVIMGLGSAKVRWGFQLGPFRKYYRAVTFDNRGVGKSDKPAGPYSMKMMADDVIGLMDYLGVEKAHVFGGSMGGMIAQELAINYPERVNKLVLASTFARRDETSGFCSEINEAIEVYERSSRDEASFRRFSSAMLPLAVNKWSNRVLLVPLMKFAMRFVALTGYIAQFEAVLAHDAADRLGMIKAPTLVMAGTEDRVVKPVSSEVIAGLVPNAKLVKVRGGGHNFPDEMRGEFNSVVLDFLKS